MHDLNFRSSQAESKIRIQKLDKTANRCNSRIHKYVKISLWIGYPSKIIPSTVNLFNPLTFGTKITRPLTFAFHFKRTYWNIQTSTKDWFMVRILRIFQNLPSAMTSASSEETSFGFHRGERNMQITLSRGNHRNHLLKRKFQTKTNDNRCEIPGRSNSYKAATCFASKYIEQRRQRSLGYGFGLFKASCREHLPVPFRALFRKREYWPILWHYRLSGTLDW